MADNSTPIFSPCSVFHIGAEITGVCVTLTIYFNILYRGKKGKKGEKRETEKEKERN